ncbi:MAG: hypothetical protein IJU44_02000 [Kiritimatiellae bacterium]|nr:hypothetical protein [Kiritimatiellia bacterium]
MFMLPGGRTGVLKYSGTNALARTASTFTNTTDAVSCSAGSKWDAALRSDGSCRVGNAAAILTPLKLTAYRRTSGASASYTAATTNLSAASGLEWFYLAGNGLGRVAAVRSDGEALEYGLQSGTWKWRDAFSDPRLASALDVS